MNDDPNQSAPIPASHNHEHSLYVLLNASNEIRHLRQRLQILNAKEQVLNIFAAALGGSRMSGGECCTVDVLGEIEAEIQRHRAAAEHEKYELEKSFCEHRNVTIDGHGQANCNTCDAPLKYDPESRNFLAEIPTPANQRRQSAPNPANPANVPLTFDPQHPN